MFTIPILLGTARKGRQSEKVANFVHKQAEVFGFKSSLVDVRDYDTSRTVAPWQKNLSAKKWGKIMSAADGLIIVTPEYNHAYPGELKIMLDQIHDEYAHKPVALCGVSSGNFGGVRMVEILQLVLLDLKMVPVHATVYFSNVEDLFDRKGNIKEIFYIKRVRELFRELQWYARVLKAGRQKA